MSHLSQLMALIMSQLLPDGWELDDAPPAVSFHRDDDRHARLALGFWLKRIEHPAQPTPQPPIDRMHLHRRGDRHE